MVYLLPSQPTLSIDRRGHHPHSGQAQHPPGPDVTDTQPFPTFVSILSSSTPTASADSTLVPAAGSLGSPSTIPSTSSHGLTTGSKVGIAISVTLLVLIFSVSIYLLTKRIHNHRKRTMLEVGKASRVDLADPELTRNTFYGLQGHMHVSPVASWLLKGARGSGGHVGRTFQPADYPEGGESLSVPAAAVQPRRSIATFTSTSDSRSQGSHVIGSRAFWTAVHDRMPPPPPSPPSSPEEDEKFVDEKAAQPEVPQSSPRKSKSTRTKKCLTLHNPDVAPSSEIL